MRTQWTAKGNRDTGSSCSCDGGLRRYLRNFGEGLNTQNPLGTPLLIPYYIQIRQWMWNIGNKFSYAHKDRTNFIKSIFTELATTWYTFVSICCTKLHASCKKKVENTVKISSTLLNKVWLWLPQFGQDLYYFVFWTVHFHNRRKEQTNKMHKINFGLINLLLFNHSKMFRPLNRSHHQGVQNPLELQAIVVIC